MYRSGEYLQPHPSPTADGGRENGDGDLPVRVVRRSVSVDDGRYAVGELELVCDGRDRATLERLVNAYHPRVDVFEVRAFDPRDTTDGTDRVLLKVQCASDDADSLWALLERRLRHDHDLDVRGTHAPAPPDSGERGAS
jgi:hypothetical protein